MRQAAEAGARTAIVGIAPAGGAIQPNWIAPLAEALDVGMDLACGLHQRAASAPELAAAARRSGATIHDVRTPPVDLPVGVGAARRGRRLLTVGTDCAVGKMFAALAITEGLRARGVPADFRATGQTGIFIAGSGIGIDAVAADFISGAVETLTPDAEDDRHWDVVEGQGSLFHPSFAGVTLGLVHGAAPDAMILCHEVGRTHVIHLPNYPLPSLTTCVDAYENAARLTNPNARVVGVSLNTRGLPGDAEARDAVDAAAASTGLPATDPLRFGVEPLLSALGS